MLKPFIEALDERILVCDGAMGTMLYAKGVFINKSFDALNLTEPGPTSANQAEFRRTCRTWQNPVEPRRTWWTP